MSKIKKETTANSSTAAIVMRCPFCKWEGHESKCAIKRSGAWIGNSVDDSGWEEWDDLVCPKCEKEVKEVSA